MKFGQIIAQHSHTTSPTSHRRLINVETMALSTGLWQIFAAYCED